MKRVINRKTYNTETSRILKKITVGNYGDPDGYEENLMQSPKGLFFIYGMGGKSSKYSDETIIPLTEKEATNWMKTNS